MGVHEPLFSAGPSLSLCHHHPDQHILPPDHGPFSHEHGRPLDGRDQAPRRRRPWQFPSHLPRQRRRWFHGLADENRLPKLVARVLPRRERRRLRRCGCLVLDQFRVSLRLIFSEQRLINTLDSKKFSFVFLPESWLPPLDSTAILALIIGTELLARKLKLGVRNVDIWAHMGGMLFSSLFTSSTPSFVLNFRTDLLFSQQDTQLVLLAPSYSKIKPRNRRKQRRGGSAARVGIGWTKSRTERGDGFVL